MKPTKSHKFIIPKVAYICIENLHAKANKISSTLPVVDSDFYFMEQIKTLKLFPFDDEDFLIVNSKGENLETTLKKLYCKNVRLFMTSVSSSYFIILQDIFVKNEFTDAILFDTASSAYIPRKVIPPNMFRFNTLDTNATKLLISFFNILNNFLTNSAIISNGSVYANGIVDIFTKNGATLINQINDEYMASQFDNFDNIIVVSDIIYDPNNNVLEKLIKVAHNYNKTKLLLLSDAYAHSYTDIIYDVVKVKLEGKDELSHSNVFSWSSGQSLSFTYFIKKIFNGKLISTLITDLLYVLDYIYRVYSIYTRKVAKKMYNILKDTEIIYTNASSTYNHGDHKIVNLAFFHANITNDTLEWVMF